MALTKKELIRLFVLFPLYISLICSVESFWTCTSPLYKFSQFNVGYILVGYVYWLNMPLLLVFSIFDVWSVSMRYTSQDALFPMDSHVKITRLFVKSSGSSTFAVSGEHSPTTESETLFPPSSSTALLSRSAFSTFTMLSLNEISPVGLEIPCERSPR